MGSGDGKKFQITIAQGNLEKEPEHNLDQVIDNIQVEIVEHVVPIIKSKQLVFVTTKLSRPVQLVIEPIYIENPYFFISKQVPISDHPIETLNKILCF